MQIEQSESIKKYFESIHQEVKKSYEVAGKARAKGFDPEDEVNIPLANTMAERVEGLISTVAPQLVGVGVPERIKKLEEKYQPLSWEVALIIAEEVANEKFCKFESKKEAMEVGIRTGFAYHTVGIVSAPLEGIVDIKLKKRKDGKEYMALNFASPIRGAGGTAAAFTFVLADYIRRKMGIEAYDPTDEEVNRFYTELEDYNDRIANLQYHPSEKETKFLVKYLPVEAEGEPTEKIEVSNYKDIPRMETNKIRGGMCLAVSMFALKAPKVWSQINKWGKDFGFEWDFVKDFLKIQKESKSKGDMAEEKTGITPDHTYIADLVAGRPVLTHPLRNGGFRLRYGRSRVTGYSATSVHPSTMWILNEYIATGTQLKVERPGKAAALTVCDTIEGPIVKLKNGNVVTLHKESEAKQYMNDIEEILYLGDYLVCYGDFLDRAHKLVPPGYCEEWYVQELEKATVDMFGALDLEKLAELVKLDPEDLRYLLKNPFESRITARAAINLSKKLNIPLHPRYTLHWNVLSPEELISLIEWMDKGKAQELDGKITKIILPFEKSQKRKLEIIGLPHLMATESIVISKDDAEATMATLCIGSDTHIEEIKQKIEENKDKTTVEIINSFSSIKIRDKSGTFIGARMGRPEKAKMRKLIGAPQVLFPVGEEGGRLRSFQAALEVGTITSHFPNYYCDKCNKESTFSTCNECKSKTKIRYFCRDCNSHMEKPCAKTKTFGDKEVPHFCSSHSKKSIDISSLFKECVKKLKMNTYPDLIKGVRGTSNKDHIPEHLAKGLLRAKNNIAVNKDGTTRYDMSEVPITHFKPKEVKTSVERLKELGYELDIKGKPLENQEQILELKPQDIILPGSTEALDESAADVLFRVTKFIDELLVSLYGLKPFYKLKKPEDLAGTLVISLAPHISAGIVGRVIGSSKTQGFYAHPLMHAAVRRDCDGDEACVILLMDALLNFSRQYLPDRRGGRTMDAPLVLTSTINPSEVDDMIHKVDVAWKYPLEFYEAALEYKQPWDVRIPTVKDFLGTEKQYEGYGFTHDVSDINAGVRCSAVLVLIFVLGFQEVFL
ncbi:DNA polymerase II large subunit, partial [Nanoarchaeota archaeon]